MTQLRVEALYGQNPAYADSRTGTLVNALVHITPEIPDVSTPLNIVWVQDRSSSMSGEKLAQSKAVLRKLLDGLNKKDHAGVIAFNSGQDILMEVEPMNIWKKGVADKRIKYLGARGSTYLSAPLKMAVDAQSKSVHPRTVVMLTDGRSECGDRKNDERDLIAAAQRLYRNNGRLIMIGIGTDYDVDLLERVVECGPDFELFHVSTTHPEQIEEVAQEVMCELRSASIGNLKIVGNISRGVELSQVTSFSPVQRDHDVKRGKFEIDSGSLSKHRGQHLLLEMLVKKPKVGSRKLATFEVSGVDSDGNTLEAAVPLQMTFTNKPKDAVKSTNKEVSDCIIRAEAHRLMKRKMYDMAAHLYELVGDDFMAKQAKHAERCAARGGREATDTHRTMTTSTVGSSRSYTRDWSTREC